ncbi:MAG: thiamine diphosphokinase [Erysipelotrichales bacterium]|nr:thiamine diphosphokinase [Erysipelotrichales bacterium]
MRAIIFTGFIEGKIELFYKKQETDYLIGCDKGAILARQAGFKCNLVLGDFDTINQELINEKKITFPAEKDETDTFIAVKEALKLGFKEIIILGGLGGRFDHSYANILILEFLRKQNIKAKLIDEKNEVFIVSGEIKLLKTKKYLSVFSFSDNSMISAKGVKYPLDNTFLAKENPIGISNEIIEAEAIINVHKGVVLIVVSSD